MSGPSRNEGADRMPQPIRGGEGGTDPGPRNVERDRQNPGVLAPPATDSGTLPNLRFSFSDAHNRLEGAGWARQATSRELPIATALAGVNYRAGDVGYVPFAIGHYVENTGDTAPRFLGVFKSDRYADVSLGRWMALSPPELVRAHPNLGGRVMGSPRKDRHPVVR